MKIAFFEVRDGERELLKAALPGHELLFYKEKLSKENTAWAVGCDVASIFINSEVNKEILDRLIGLRYITIRATGFDNIDVEYAKSKSITVSNVPGYGATTVAEFTFGLLLNLSRKIYEASRQMSIGTSYDVHGLRGFELHGKTLGVIGTGRIGKNVIRIAKGFGMVVVASDAFPDLNFAKEMGFEYRDLNGLLAISDIVSIHTPYNKMTHHLLNKDNILLMKIGAYLINTARGEIIDTEALVINLKSGHIAGVGLDVIEGERTLKEEADLLTHGKMRPEDFRMIAEDHMLLDMPNVIMTPHIAFYTKEAEVEIIKTTAENILNFSEGKPQNLV
ncbi:MAG: hydroxyacid dehydrogenase [Candidatus Vogelbacteria bacterium]|nr:hydroxyacid dehydrogenase [Candidatus Vogelbacteria bacterium]